MLVRFEDWLHADEGARNRALAPLVARIEALEPTVRAWVEVNPRPGAAVGPLSGIPFGVKDVIETAGMATEYGSAIYRGRRGAFDADIVTRLCGLGGILLGKTQSAAFACRTPAITRNPRNPEHTPGGSSSGSAAAVAADMIPFAVGTQTHGSVLRPASFCGVTGFKPTFGRLPMGGVLPVAPSLDTLGLFTHTPRGMQLLWAALGYDSGRSSAVIGYPDPPPEVHAEMAAAFQSALDRLSRSGFEIHPLPIGQLLADLPSQNRIVESYEGARVHEARYAEFGDRLLDVADMVREGLRISHAQYESALAHIAEAGEAIRRCFIRTPVIATPAATGPAPHGLASTGDARMNSPWTALGTPAITIPMPVASEALPLGLQLCGARDSDGALLETAHSVAAALEGANGPVL